MSLPGSFPLCPPRQRHLPAGSDLGGEEFVQRLACFMKNMLQPYQKFTACPNSILSRLWPRWQDAPRQLLSAAGRCCRRGSPTVTPTISKKQMPCHSLEPTRTNSASGAKASARFRPVWFHARDKGKAGTFILDDTRRCAPATREAGCGSPTAQGELEPSTKRGSVQRAGGHAQHQRCYRGGKPPLCAPPRPPRKPPLSPRKFERFLSRPRPAEVPPLPPPRGAPPPRSDFDLGGGDLGRSLSISSVQPVR